MRDYFKWLVAKLDDGTRNLSRFQLLLQNLYLTRFYAVNPSDRNRAVDGTILRRKFEEETGYEGSEASSHLDGDCSVLEMMIALAERIEHDYLKDFKKGSQVGTWFFVMLESLGLDKMDNKSFRDDDFEETMVRFLTKEGNVKKGKPPVPLFPNDRPGLHMETLPIWDQMIDWVNRRFL